MIKVTVWNENFHETLGLPGNPLPPDTPPERVEKVTKSREQTLACHPNGLHNTLADIVKELGSEVTVRTATLLDPACGLSEEVLCDTDVLIWWGHTAHDKVPDEVVDRVQLHVLKGMGLILLHSGHHSKIFKRMMGTTCDLRWRDDTYERVFCISPNHPIAKGIPASFELGLEECYGESFDIPAPDELIFLGWYDIGEVFRSGCTWNRGFGKIFYFQPGHETNRSFENKYVRQIIKNAVRWAKADSRREVMGAPHIDVTLEEKRLGTV